MQRNFKKRNDFNSSMLNAMALLNWTLMLILMLMQQIKTTNAVKFKGDSCTSKNQPGICKEWGECPIIKTLIESGQYTNREVVSCGFGVREELICCPEFRTNPNRETTTVTNTDRFVMPETTTQAAVKDFWLDLLVNTSTTTPTTSAKPDFWLDLLVNTTTTTPSTTAKPDFWLDLLTTTTTIKPLIVGEQRLNESSEFFDLNALLSGQHTGGSKQERQVTTVRSITNQNSNEGFVNSGNLGNDRGSLSTGPVNLNQWSGNNFKGNGIENNHRGQGNIWKQNNGRAPGNHGNGRGSLSNEPDNLSPWSNNNFKGNGIGNNGHGQGNFWNQNNGRGPGLSWPQNNGRGQGNPSGANNGRGPHNNGRGRHGIGNPNRGFIFPDSNTRPNHFFENELQSSHRPNRPVNSLIEQNPNLINSNFQPSSSLSPTILNNDTKNKGEEEEEKNVEDLIKDVFDTSAYNNKNLEVPVTNQERPSEINLQETIASVFNLKPQTNLQPQPINSFNNEQGNISPVAWPSPQNSDSTLNPVEYIQLPVPQSQSQQHQQVPYQNPHMTGNFQLIPAVQHQINNNDLEVAPSTSFIQQPVVVETWSNTSPVQQTEYNPAQVVYENLLSSGIDIVKSHEMQHQQQQFIQQPQVFVVQPQISNPQQVFFQQPQHLIQQPLQQLIQQPQPSDALTKEQRSTSSVFQQPNTGFVPNIQSPPVQILDSFKPFEFRPPPGNENIFSEDNNSLSPTPSQRDSSGGDRPAVRACRRIEQGLIASLSPHILGGTPAELGEFPHMVAIGYSRIGGDNRPPYDIRCGGTLIDKRFVLTAAHCVSDRENVPTIVRLGVVNFTDPDQMSQAVELRIKETFIHDNYSTRLTYNDIAILELERDVETSEFIYPVCLYTNETDPDTKIKLWVTGWGTVNTTTRSFSDILLKAPLHTSPLQNCNRSFTEYGLNRRIPEGIIRTQFCAEDKDQIKDACQGDSGGPLNLIVDESLKNYRLVGIVSSGFGCASSTPGLYTRVAAFLDFIEKIVWPNGGD